MARGVVAARDESGIDRFLQAINEIEADSKAVLDILVAALDAAFLTRTPIGLRDRALIGTMVYTFARVNAVLDMKVKDYFIQGRRGWVRLHEKGGKEHEVPCHHTLERFLDEYIAAAVSTRRGP